MKHKVNKTLPRSHPNRNKLKAIIGSIIGVIATFCTISGISGVFIWDYIYGSGESIPESEVNESLEIKDQSTIIGSPEPDESTGIVVSLSTGESSLPDKTSIKDDSTMSGIPLEESSSLSNESSPEECKIFLYSEYSKITIYGENNMTATLNFETDEVTITAYLASGKVDALTMDRKNSTEWGKKVIFNETGIHKIVATATAPNGCVIEGTTEIEVIPVNLGDYNFNQLFQFT